jgi:hypothetical protein
VALVLARRVAQPALRRGAARWPIDDAHSLSALRIVVALLILVSPEFHQAAALAANPALLDVVPEGAGWLPGWSLTPSYVRWASIVVLSSGVLAVLGFHARASLGLLTLAALPLYSLSQRSGTVLHDMHLFWLSGLLALSPCSDVWALDGWGEPRRRAPAEYALPAQFCRASLGVIYLFPGLHKLFESGWAWGSAPHVIAQMHAKWFQMAELPWFRIDHWAKLCALGGYGVLLFELAFLPLALWRPTRPLAALLGVAFHFGTQAFLFIPFVSLWACYVVLVPWSAVLRPKRTVTEASRAKRSAQRPTLTLREQWRALPRGVWPALLYGSTLLTGAAVQGARGQTQAWPIACYPTFAQTIGETLPDLLMVATSPSGDQVRFTGRERGPRSQAEWGRVFRISGAYGDTPNAAALRQHALLAAQRGHVPLLRAAPIAVYRAEFATAPELWRKAPRALRLLLTFTPP